MKFFQFAVSVLLLTFFIYLAALLVSAIAAALRLVFIAWKDEAGIWGSFAALLRLEFRPLLPHGQLLLIGFVVALVSIIVDFELS